ncbi:hypothetical protein M9434_003485 [Picochlorum sp. BPE23]|nr:hypothetical protein M9434_003485 [Picochlorum sp. BPE23]
MDFFATQSGSDDGDEFELHDIVEQGDVDALTALLTPPAPAPIVAPEMIENGIGLMGDVSMVPAEPSGMDGVPGLGNVGVVEPGPTVDLNARDRDGCTPLHVSILYSKLDCMKILLEKGARVVQKLEGSLPLHMAVQVSSLDHVQRHQKEFGVEAINLLVEYGCIILDRDDHGRTPLHWAASFGLLDECVRLVEIGQGLLDKVLEDKAASLEGNPFDEAPPLWDFQDKQGNLALHLAARYGHADVVRHLVGLKPAAVEEKNKSGLSAAHMAALGGDLDTARVLMELYPSCSGLHNRQKRTPGEIAEKRGHPAVAAVFSGTEHVNHKDDHPPTPTIRGSSLSIPRWERKTLIVAPPECLNHHTAPWPITREASAPPPENVERLTVLTSPEIGTLKTSAFRHNLVWDRKSRKAALADILKVHDWGYVLKLQKASESIEDDPTDIRHLDGDTAISHGTFKAALAAAGAVCHAIDEVMEGRAKNAFCPVRPPGHHAGPHGVVTSRMDPNGSHGFCLLNNVAIGAAYAMSVYHNVGIKKVAILDFDVHHGNGTEACVANTAPSMDTFEFATPYGKGTQTFPIYKPWYDESDKDNIFFASVQGYGPKGYGMGAYVYPGSGATCDTWQVSKSSAREINEVSVNPMDGVKPPEEIEEDPDAEFAYGGGEMPRTEGPRIIDVGIPGPGHHVPKWKRSWRDKIFPALVKFEPDLILLSAGFDAHRKDDINFSYIGIQEKDFEWITDQVVQIANRCCHGRIVSVLEGGYRIQGNVVSAFARSVAAHVRALAEPNFQQWDSADAKFEREREKRLRAEMEEKRRAEAAEKAAREAAERAAQEAAANTVPFGTQENDTQEEKPAGVDQAFESPDAGGRQKRRRSTVDYVALNKKLEEEAKMKKPQ